MADRVSIEGPRLRRAGRRRVTMTDVARAAHCSQSTVSLVLNDNRDIVLSEATRERVRQAALRLGYPGLDGEAAAPRPQATNSVGFLIDWLATSPEAVVAVDGVQQALRPTGGVVLVTESRGDRALERRTVEALLDRGVDAVIYACIFTREVTLPDRLAGAEIPVVLLNCYEALHRRPSVVPSEIAGGQRAAKALLDAGHRRIATITGEAFMEAARDRLEGYRRALATADIPFDPALVAEGDWSPSAGFELTRELLARPDPPTAIFCQNDRMAIGCYEAVKELGLAIPGDVSVVGYDDEEIARHLFPPLSTLVLPHRAMGRWAVEAIERRAGDEPPRLSKLECDLVERGSIGPPPRAADAAKARKG